MNGTENRNWYAELAKEGEYCHLCRKTLQDLIKLYDTDKPLRLYELKHSRPILRQNLMFLCVGCNKKKMLNKRNILKRNPTPEHAVSLQCKPLFRKWLLGEILKTENNHHVPYDQVVKQGAYEIDVDIETIKRWLEPLLDHPTSPYVTIRDNYGEIQIWEKESAPEEDNDIY